MSVFAILLAAGIALSPLSADARSKSAKYQFQKANPCPINGRHFGKCPGYVIDHVLPLCAGGHDHRDNMQWQTIREAKIKDIEEARQCRAIKRSNRE